MKQTKLYLHADQKRKLLLTASFSLLTCLFIWVLINSAGLPCAQLYALIQSGYKYSAKLQKPVGQDDYYLYDAAIGFIKQVDTEKGINAEVVMQTESSDYTRLVYWNAEKLGKDEVAVSGNIAREYGLNTGDAIYSKHIVDGVFQKYTVKRILPEIADIRYVKESVISEGVVIMGYDETYFRNLTYNVLVFTKLPVNELQKQSSVLPTEILYRSDEIENVKRILLPFLIMTVAISALIAYIFVSLLYRCFSANYKRLITLGFERKILIKTFYFQIFEMSGFAIVLTSFMALMLFLLMGSGIIVVLLLSIILGVEVLSIVVSAIFIRMRAWRI